MSADMMRKLAKPMLFGAALIWGTSFFIMKDVLDVMPVFSLLAIRFTAGAVLLGLVCWKKWKDFTLDYLWRGSIIGAFLFLAYLIQTYGLEQTTPSKSAFLTAVYCVLVPFFYWMVMKRKPDRYNVAAAVLCVVGVGLVSFGEITGIPEAAATAGSQAMDLSINFGDVLTLIAAGFYAAHIIAVEKTSQGKDIYLLTVMQFAFAAVYAWIGSLCLETMPLQAMAEPSVYLRLLYLCAMPTTVALLFQNVGQIWSDPASASVILSLESVFGVLFSVLFSGDVVTMMMGCGFVCIFVAVVCSETKFSFLRRSQKR